MTQGTQSKLEWKEWMVQEEHHWMKPKGWALSQINDKPHEGVWTMV